MSHFKNLFCRWDASQLSFAFWHFQTCYCSQGCLVIQKDHTRVLKATPAICRHLFPTMLTQVMHKQIALLTHPPLKTDTHPLFGPVSWFCANSKKKLQSSCHTVFSYWSYSISVCATTAQQNVFRRHREELAWSPSHSLQVWKHSVLFLTEHEQILSLEIHGKQI